MLSSSRLSLLFLLTACSGAPEPAEPPAEATKAEPEAVVTATPTTCTASAAWISSPQPPPDVASAETFCDFYQFSWQWFLAQVSPANPADPAGDRVFEATNRLVVPDKSKTNQCATNALSGRKAAATLLDVRDAKPVDFEDIQADQQPLYDQKGNVVYYNMWYSPQECEATSAGFVAGTLEIKTAWRILPSDDGTYLTMKATVPVIPAGGGAATTQDVTLGLVGLHLVNWTPTHPEMIWATFEHKSNAPLCSGASKTPAGGWSFASDAAAACLAANPSPNGTIPSACAAFDFNTGPVADPSGGAQPTTGTPDEVCQLFDMGTDSGTAVNGNDNAANALAISQLNDALVGPSGLLTALPSDNPMAVWKHYKMIGGLWTKGGADSGSPPPVPSQQGPANANSPQRGSLELTNMTMETYEQGQGSFVPNCFGCHNYTSTDPLAVSHIATEFLLPTSTASKAAPAGTTGASAGGAAPPAK